MREREIRVVWADFARQSHTNLIPLHQAPRRSALIRMIRQSPIIWEAWTAGKSCKKSGYGIILAEKVKFVCNGWANPIFRPSDMPPSMEGATTKAGYGSVFSVPVTSCHCERASASEAIPNLGRSMPASGTASGASRPAMTQHPKSPKNSCYAHESLSLSWGREDVVQ